ncbi:MAG: hypothetical protein KAQ64_00190 [Candidatus Pacebacteria bacterium]|nr:hypothetical protein [Candidatus Paceibacterota bacterium]
MTLEEFMFENGIVPESTNCSRQIPEFLKEILEAIITKNDSNKERIDQLQKQNKDLLKRIELLENKSIKRKLARIIEYLKGLIK